jgi:hypothetical protein
MNSRDLDIAADGSFMITVDADAPGDRENHLQSTPDGMRMIIRDSLAHWRQTPVELEIERVSGGKPRPEPSDAEVAGAVTAALEGYARSWLDYLGRFDRTQPVNAIAAPQARDGGWGYLSIPRYDLAEDEALVLTADDAGAEYMSIQATDPWNMGLNPQKTVFSYTSRQARPDAEGRSPMSFPRAIRAPSTGSIRRVSAPAG